MQNKTNEDMCYPPTYKTSLAIPVCVTVPLPLSTPSPGTTGVSPLTGGVGKFLLQATLHHDICLVSSGGGLSKTIDVGQLAFFVIKHK